MRKLLLFLPLLLCLLLTACQDVPPQPGETETPPIISAEPTSGPDRPPETPEDPSPTPPEEVYAPGLLIGEDFWQEDYWTDDGVLLLRVSIAWPKLSNDFPAALRVAFHDLADADRQKAERLRTLADDAYRSAPETFTAYDWEKNFTVERNDGIYLSVLFDETEYTGGVHGSEIVWAVNCHMPDGDANLSLDDRFTVDPDVWLARMSDLICARIATNAEDYYPNYEQLVWDNFGVFCLTDSGLAFFYEPYILGPYTLGVRRFDIPFDLYEDIWKG